MENKELPTYEANYAAEERKLDMKYNCVEIYQQEER